MRDRNALGCVYLGLPAFNEEQAIKPLFARIRDAKKDLSERNLVSDLKVIFYDDGSTDKTVSEVRSEGHGLEIFLLKPESNGGLGVALRGIFTQFLETASISDVLVIMDTDDTHDPSQISDLLTQMEDSSLDVVIASRYRPGSRTSGVPGYRQILSLGFAGLVKVLLPIRNVRDYSCGYRAYTYSSVKVIDQVTGFPIQESGFASMPEILIRLRRASLAFGEIPLRLSYDRRLTVSKMRAWENSRRLLGRIGSWRFRPKHLNSGPWAGPQSRTWWEVDHMPPTQQLNS